jgi:hypothetical protein
MTARIAIGALALPMLLAGCATSEERWRSVSNEGPLAPWARCMETDGYEAWDGAGRAAALAQDDGATPITRTQIFLIGLAGCEALGGETLPEFSPQAPSQFYRDTERMLFRKLAQAPGRREGAR